MIATRPKDKKEMQEREVVGVFRASRFVREYAKSHGQISVDILCKIHANIFEEAWPEIAGVFRDEDISRISGSDHVPPHWRQIPSLMREMDEKMYGYVADLTLAEGLIQHAKDESAEFLKTIESVLKFAAYVHHAITYIHPFRDGNGRTARLAANLILERYGLIGISIKIERENKNRYCDALAQIDKYEDYEPLLNLMAEGLVDRYGGVPMRLVKDGK